ncbi:MAG: pre-16S rRNA-processing nuclease YqgF [Clostridia bacterium]|nr:pre-16S rRNA-processing nuclease YqgF [Clostridia bacterium]
MDEGLVVAVDPGREKAGIAVCSRERGTIAKCVVPAADCVSRVYQLAVEHGARVVVVGDRTGSTLMVEALSDRRDLVVAVVDEHRSSMEARERYLRDHPGRGLARLLPNGLRTPSEPYDDYVAEILAARYFEQV